jgi:hypothetical protein
MINHVSSRTAITIVVLMTIALQTVPPHPIQDSASETAGKTIVIANPRKVIEHRARQVILAIKKKDMTRLSTFIHPDRGIRFTPYTYVSIDDDLVFTRSNIKNLWSNKDRFVWGSYEGSGDPILLTFRGYYKQFIYDFDFAGLRSVTYQSSNTGSSMNNPWEFYPGAIVVGYHWPGREAPRGGAMDWKGLRLVFQEKAGKWYLVGIIHDEWLI